MFSSIPSLSSSSDIIVKVFFSLFCIFISVFSVFLYLSEFYMAYVFFAIFSLFFFLNRPRYLISPLAFFYLYYFVFYILSPIFAERYSGVILDPYFSLSYLFILITFLVGSLSLIFGESYGFKCFSLGRKYHFIDGFRGGLRLAVFVLYFLSTLMCYLIVANSGGVVYWLESPGQAFLNRSGTGVYVILSHFFSIILAAIVGYISFVKKKYISFFIFLLWLAFTSPVHGSKMQISLLLLVALIPTIKSLNFISFKSFITFGVLSGIFFLGLYFRNNSWMTIGNMVPYGLNYFTALENLAVSLKDFPPGLLTTFWLPFNKFLTPFGLSDSSIYYDMNHFLTDIYYPENWAVRATEQWPVETDLYLNFYFVFGLPLFAFYLFLVGFFYGKARRHNNLGAWLVSLLLIVGIMSHLRGSLYNHVDFYSYPMFFVFWLLLRKFDLR